MSSPPAIARNANGAPAGAPHAIRMDERDNVAIVANASGLEAGKTFAAGQDERRWPVRPQLAMK